MASFTISIFNDILSYSLLNPLSCNPLLVFDADSKNNTLQKFSFLRRGGDQRVKVLVVDADSKNAILQKFYLPKGVGRKVEMLVFDADTKNAGPQKFSFLRGEGGNSKS